MTDLSLTVRREMPRDADAIERLHARAFGPGRYARSAFRLREGADERPDLCFTAHVGTFLVGSVRLSPIRAGAEAALILGPLTVEPAFEGRGIGLALLDAAIAAARAADDTLIVLVGDEAYYARSGFRRTPAGWLILPGPVDPARVLALELQPGALDRARGQLSAR